MAQRDNPRKLKRFQHCNWFVRLCRRGHYLRYPFLMLKYLHPKTPLWLAHRLAVTQCQYHMNWYYTLDEVKERLFKD